MRTSLNQLAEDCLCRSNAPREEKYTLPPQSQPYYFRFLSLGDRKVDIRLRLLDISKFGAQVQSDDSLDDLPVNGGFEAVIEGDTIAFPDRFKGVIVWKRREGGCCAYGVSFNHAIEINLITAVMEKARGIAEGLRKPGGRKIHARTLSFLYEAEQSLNRFTDQINSLDELINGRRRDLSRQIFHRLG